MVEGRKKILIFVIFPTCKYKTDLIQPNFGCIWLNQLIFNYLHARTNGNYNRLLFSDPLHVLTILVTFLLETWVTTG